MIDEMKILELSIPIELCLRADRIWKDKHIVDKLIETRINSINMYISAITNLLNSVSSKLKYIEGPIRQKRAENLMLKLEIKLDEYKKIRESLSNLLQISIPKQHFVPKSSECIISIPRELFRLIDQFPQPMYDYGFMQRMCDDPKNIEYIDVNSVVKTLGKLEVEQKYVRRKRSLESTIIALFKSELNVRIRESKRILNKNRSTSKRPTEEDSRRFREFQIEERKLYKQFGAEVGGLIKEIGKIFKLKSTTYIGVPILGRTISKIVYDEDELGGKYKEITHGLSVLVNAKISEFSISLTYYKNINPKKPIGLDKKWR